MGLRAHILMHIVPFGINTSKCVYTGEGRECPSVRPTGPSNFLKIIKDKPSKTAKMEFKRVQILIVFLLYFILWGVEGRKVVCLLP